VTEPKELRPRGWLRRHLRRWGGVWLAALALLGLSQALWWWESWPVRQLLDTPVQAGVRG
jgi:hypothetical protein